MSNTWYTSDTHFGHKALIENGLRKPYIKSVEDMDNLLIELWNMVVKPEDEVYHLGDVVWKTDYDLSVLNGNKTLIIGNHDHKKRKYLEQFFDIWDDSIKIDHQNKLVMCHYPLHIWPQQDYGYIHLHGHMHGFLEYHPLAVDVGVDNFEMQPISMRDIREELAFRKIRNKQRRINGI